MFELEETKMCKVKCRQGGCVHTVHLRKTKKCIHNTDWENFKTHHLEGIKLNIEKCHENVKWIETAKNRVQLPSFAFRC